MNRLISMILVSAVFVLCLAIQSPVAAGVNYACKLTYTDDQRPLSGDNFNGDVTGNEDECCCDSPPDSCCELYFYPVTQTGDPRDWCNHNVRTFDYDCVAYTTPSPPTGYNVPCGTIHVYREYWRNSSCSDEPTGQYVIQCPNCISASEFYGEYNCAFAVWQDILQDWYNGTHVPSYQVIQCCSDVTCP